MRKKILKKAWKHKEKVLLAGTHGLAFGTGAVAGTKTAFSIVNFDPHQRVQNQRMEALQMKMDKKLNRAIKKALKAKGVETK